MLYLALWFLFSLSSLSIDEGLYVTLLISAVLSFLFQRRKGFDIEGCILVESCLLPRLSSIIEFERPRRVCARV